MSDKAKLDKKLKRFRAMLAHFNTLIKDADREFKAKRISKQKCEKLKRKYEARKNAVISKMKKVKLKAKK